ncbi:MAG: glycogen-binding domain-containing protein [Phycisphaerae bacterium]|nr:glycogen-binding domain-containing protein [Phycisphaerae bacterium]
MKKIEREKEANPAVFRCQAPGAKEVFLAGSFNNWDPKATPMERARDGTWHRKLNLPPGRHEFKFVVDGEWRCDQDSDDETDPCCVPNLFGTMNHVIDVPSPDERDTEAACAVPMAPQLGAVERGIL